MTPQQQLERAEAVLAVATLYVRQLRWEAGVGHPDRRALAEAELTYWAAAIAVQEARAAVTKARGAPAVSPPEEVSRVPEPFLRAFALPSMSPDGGAEPRVLAHALPVAPPTARLQFARWLYAHGRLSDGEDGMPTPRA